LPLKLAICYTVFGTELLTESINNIIDQVDKVIICYQEVSNTGNKKPFDWAHHFNPKHHLIQYIPELRLGTKENERRKHQLMIDTAHKLGCSHFILSATDHFYRKDEVIKAKEKALNYDVTFTGMYTYFKYPIWQITPLETYFMPFICKLPAKIVNRTKYPLLVDPSVRVEHKTWYLFNEDECMLHHFSAVRKDIKAKYDNAAASVNWSEEKVKGFLHEYEMYDIHQNPGISYFKGRKVKEVPNYFGIWK
jgi:hypothetical protein